VVSEIDIWPELYKGTSRFIIFLNVHIEAVNLECLKDRDVIIFRLLNVIVSLLCASLHSVTSMLSTHNIWWFPANTFSHALATMELLMLRRHLLSVSDFCFSAEDLSKCILDVCT